ncbi:hypothetical protein Acr_00g0028390 [Actinidia rufa]|uniref:CCHC-type domain-containing protein n=1 Tax=Actinidia rufa TaxID=165716 RepID=A0A7J0DE88_9ERIC|nr:hypothetical protein Acr_00g0028390 [Actinidia rufa]
MAEHNLGSMIVLSATNYAIWKPRMEDILFCKDLHDPLDNKGEKPEAKKDEEWRKMNKKTIGLIRQCIGHEVFHHVAQETSAYDLWIKLEEMYQSKTSRNKALLMRRLVNLKLQRETTVAEHTSEFQSLVNQLTSVDLQFDDEMQALLLLSSLPESWETLVVSLSNSAPNGKLTTSMVMDALFNEETRRREMGSTDQSESQALVSEGSRERGRGQGRGHHRGTGKGRWRSQARGRTVRCFYCDHEGHIKRDCPKYKAQDQSSDTAATAVMAVDEDEIDVLLAASDNGKSDWHARDVYGWRTTQLVEFVGRGSVRFRMADGGLVTLTGVRHVPNLRKNLISIGMLDAKGCSFEASGGILRVSKGNKEMLWGKKTGGYTDWRGMSRQGELLSDMGPVVLARRMGKGSNRCIEVRKASVGVLGGSVMVPGGSGVLCAQGRRDGATTTRKVTYFAAAHPVGGVVRPGGGCKAPWYLECCLAVLWGAAGSEVVRKDNLKISDYPPVGWRGRLLSPAHLDESKPTWMSPSPVAKPKLVWSSCGVSM